MPVSSSPSLAELERLVEEKKSQIQAKLEKRERLQKELEALDQEIQGAVSLDGALVRRRAGGRRRVKNELSLREAVKQVLGKNKKGQSLADLATHVTETGYKSHSHNFRNVLYPCVYNSTEIVHDKATGLYKLKKA
jgi:hypothetical protein